MQCPICKKDLQIKNKKVGENEAGEAIYNEFAICRDCKKQWNLDKQREKKKKLAKEIDNVVRRLTRALSRELSLKNEREIENNYKLQKEYLDERIEALKEYLRK